MKGREALGWNYALGAQLPELLLDAFGATLLFASPPPPCEYVDDIRDGIPIYNENKSIINTYALVFFDGPHTTELVKYEFDFFYNKIPVGGILVFDDINQYNHMENLDKYSKSTTPKFSPIFPTYSSLNGCGVGFAPNSEVDT